MENSVVNTIEKIKLQEIDKETKLKEKREIEGIIANLQKGIRDNMSQIERAAKEEAELTARTGQLSACLEITRIRREALKQQILDSSVELEGLKADADKGIANVWSIRSSLADAVHQTADSCDIRALLMKPRPVEPVKPKHHAVEPAPAPLHGARLQAAAARRDAARAERDRLLAEPETGEEFLRLFPCVFTSLLY